jgi:hypothetical protein
MKFKHNPPIGEAPALANYSFGELACVERLDALLDRLPTNEKNLTYMASGPISAIISTYSDQGLYLGAEMRIVPAGHVLKMYVEKE